MCGRYALIDLQAALKEAGLGIALGPKTLLPRYNIAPSQDVAAVLNASSGRLTMARWGLIPHWAKDPKTGRRMINARAETVAEKPAFREPFRQKRCLVLADGFYEWQRIGKHKVPYRIMLEKGRPFAFAGLWDVWENPTAPPPLTTCTIITTSANTLVRRIHDRMPVILDRISMKTWLSDDLTEARARALLKPYPPEKMRAVEISPLINAPSNDGPDIIKPASRPMLAGYDSAHRGQHDKPVL